MVESTKIEMVCNWVRPTSMIEIKSFIGLAGYYKQFILGFKLMQQGCVIAYAWRKINVNEHNYPIHDLELAALVFTLKILRDHLYGFHCEIFTDHQSLQYMLSQKNLYLRRHRWIELLKDYDNSIMYHH
ncbi:hypothetical protein MTR67_007451 [Solanum verrucosum]|uniref:Reverse transcriptase RNase H-like domain-containing protein n=1 Tax=Solanum verrucosum TaxID=315347 RepID=A0AAF0Q557_SOLVR|nr:hypothetical protein MTR67_007451 [Solanum verrucosum]